MKKGHATVLFSGGVDSTSCIHFLKDQGYNVSGVFVDYGQPAASMENRSVRVLSSYLGIEYEHIRAQGPKMLGSGEILGRNAFLINIALTLAHVENGLLVIGVHSGTPYYDCSSDFISRISPMVEECSNGLVAVAAPFANWNKLDVYNYFIDADLPSQQTYSCELGLETSCLVCASCKDREML